VENIRVNGHHKSFLRAKEKYEKKNDSALNCTLN